MDLNDYAREAYAENSKWWFDPETGAPLNKNIPEQLMLIVSEVAEAMEGDRKDLMDTHVPHRKMFDVELADACIRIFQLCGAKGVDLQGAYTDKTEFNRIREDHSAKARKSAHGKKY